MKVSLNWIEEYLDKKNLDINNVALNLTAKSFEVEEIDESRRILDIDILPNRAHDCLCHRGIAREVAASFDGAVKFVDKEISVYESDKAGEISLNVESDSCRRYIGVEIKNVKVGPSSDDLRKKIESIGERSINNIVDITNIVMFELGQPMHAFDTDKLDGNEIVVRKAQDGEQLTTLDNKEVKLDDSISVIADSNSALAIAGVKGGKKAEVNSETKNIILESANFHPTKTRLASKKLGIQTESSKRFENEITPWLCDRAINMAVDLIKKYAATDETEYFSAIEYYPKEVKPFYLGLSLKEVQNLIGSIKDGGHVRDIEEKEVEDALNKLQFTFEKINPTEKIIKEAKLLAGKKYKWGASVRYDSPELFDCSSFVAYVFAKNGVLLPRISADQFVYGTEINENELNPGDLIFSINPDDMSHGIHYESKEFLPQTKIESGVDHVGIYLGNNEVMHATNWQDSGVIIEKIDQSQRFKNIVGYRRFFTPNETRFVVLIPEERLDLILISGKFEMKQIDLIEEVGRIISYEKIVSQEIAMPDFKPSIDKEYFYKNKIRNILAELGYSEIMTYTFVDSGYLQPEKPLAADKNYLRSNLRDGMQKALELNVKNADLLGLDQIKTFEIGTVFNQDMTESLILCLGVANKSGIKKPKPEDIISESVAVLAEKLNTNIKAENKNILEINLNTLLENLPDPKGDYDRMPEPKEISFSPISQFPFITRDIAVWIPNSDSEEDLIKIIIENSGELLIGNPRKFDQFEKDGRTSYAYRMVYQSFEKTLTDDEVNQVMEKIYSEISKKDNWEVR